MKAMSLVKTIPEETQEQIAALIHEEICETHDDDMDEAAREDCLTDDIATVRDILDLLDRVGVTYSPVFIPMKGDDDTTTTLRSFSNKPTINDV